MTDLELALAAARAGSAVVKQGYGQATATEWKGRSNPVTLVDHAAEEAILAVIGAHRPGEAVLAEESGGTGWDRGSVWIVDPLDGTVNFIHGIPQIAVSVAHWVDGQPEVGVIVDVCRQEVFAAARGQGALLNRLPIHVSPRDDLDESVIATGFPYDHNVHGRRYAEVMGEVLTRVRGIRRIGSAALDLAWVACGRFDGYWEFGIQPWDAAAGVLLVEESGGRVTNLQGGRHRLDDGVIVASNERIHGPLLAALAAA